MGSVRGMTRPRASQPVPPRVRRRIRGRAASFALAGGVAGACLPTTALAEACATLRPDWDGTAVTALDELLYLVGTAPALLLILGAALAIRLQSQWGGLIVIVLWTVLVTYILMGNQDIARAATLEGCIGSPALFIALVAAICVAIVVRTLPRPSER